MKKQEGKKESTSERFRKLDNDFQKMNENRVKQGKEPVVIDAMKALAEVREDIAKEYEKNGKISR